MFAVFATAGAIKLVDVPAFRETLLGLGVPFRLTRPVARMLPTAELVVAVGLLFQESTRWAAAAAVLLLLLFIAVIAATLFHGTSLDCNCFGQFASEQIGPRTLLRNVALVAVSALIVWEAPGSPLTGWTGDTAAANIVAAIAIFAALGLLIVLLHQRRTPAQEPAVHPTHFRLVPGAKLPTFRLDAADGSSVELDELLARGRPTILIFASPICLPCRELIPEVGKWNETMRDSITFAVIESAVGDLTRFAEQNALPGGLTVLVESGLDIALRYGMTVTPAGLALGPGGRLLGPPAHGPVEIEQMVQAVLKGVPEPAVAAGMADSPQMS